LVVPVSVRRMVARFFSVQNTKTPKIYQRTTTYVPSGHKINHFAEKYVDKMDLKILTSSITRPSKIYPKCDFWFENIHTIWQHWSDGLS
jgi:hypothetical protein